MRLIDADKLKADLEQYRFAIVGFEGVLAVIDNSPTVEYTFEEAFQKTVCEQKLYCPKSVKDNCNEWTSVCTGTCYGRDTFSAEDMRCGGN